ncbi:hypothetical protein B9479_003228 [Cryptococcus floricola]|uniref:Uncharacterized protein n=1 Tax=Cryptococcus floricola TaxID=2591691 RepID=A0A5D3AZ97_9TREE|nr:hypothetical protein B9479_003228 [Cryptococcus floricola]
MSYNAYRQSQHYPPQQTPLHDDYQGQGPYSPEEEHDEPFDVRADFDVKGPKWSAGAGAGAGGGLKSPGLEGETGRGSVMGMGVVGDRSSYMPVGDHSPSGEYASQDKSLASREELVSVPVLGPEWRKGELHDMSRRGQNEIQGDKRKRAWRAWNRDQRGLCGMRWLSRKVLVMIIFVLLAALGVALYFLIPRAPTFKFYGDDPFSVRNETINFNRSPTNYSFSGNLNLWGDASSSYLPVHFTHLEATVYDHVTSKKIATGDWGNHVMAHKEQQAVLLPIDFSYSAVNTSDTTWNDMYNACAHIWTGTTRPDLKFRLVLEMSIVGLVKKTSTTLEISDVTCPFELASDGV